MVIGIVGAMLLFIVPTFETLYESLGGTLPLPTRMLMGASNVLRRFFPLVVVAVVVLAFLFRRWKASRAGPLPVGQLQAQGQGVRPAVPQDAPCRASPAPWPP